MQRFRLPFGLRAVPARRSIVVERRRATFDFQYSLGWVQTRARQFPHQTWAVFDADAVPFRDGEFDALFAGEMVEHVPDVRRTLREWWRVLKPGGVAVITTPNRERLVALAEGLESLQPRPSQTNCPTAH